MARCEPHRSINSFVTVLHWYWIFVIYIYIYILYIYIYIYIQIASHVAHRVRRLLGCGGPELVVGHHASQLPEQLPGSRALHLDGPRAAELRAVHHHQRAVQQKLRNYTCFDFLEVTHLLSASQLWLFLFNKIVCTSIVYKTILDISLNRVKCKQKKTTNFPRIAPEGFKFVTSWILGKNLTATPQRHPKWFLAEKTF